MTEMVNRVGEAISAAGMAWIETNQGTGWADIPESVFAVAAIEAMREPTLNMTIAGKQAIKGCDSTFERVIAETAWSAMVHEAMK